MRIFLPAVCACGLPLAVEAAEPVRITKIEPTIFFPAAKAGEPLRQTVRLGVESAGATREATVRIRLPPVPAYDEPIGKLAAGATVHAIHVPDIVRPAELTVELYEKDNPKPVAVQKTAWRPQRKWKVYCVSYSHQDLGYGDYPHRLRTTIRHANIERLLRFCRETDSWDEDSRFRFMIETSEPVTSFLASHSEAEAAELARRVRRGTDSDRRPAQHGQHRATEPRVPRPVVLPHEPPHPRPAGDAGRPDGPDRRRDRAELAVGNALPGGGRAVLLPRPQHLRPLFSAGFRRARVLLARAGRPGPGARPQRSLRGLQRRHRRQPQRCATSNRSSASSPARAGPTTRCCSRRGPISSW